MMKKKVEIQKYQEGQEMMMKKVEIQKHQEGQKTMMKKRKMYKWKRFKNNVKIIKKTHEKNYGNV
jgi:ABC-type nitrate/sulfonate/bicarbonate transport system ATPase subunit